jgi:hypothetical protein
MPKSLRTVGCLTTIAFMVSAAYALTFAGCKTTGFPDAGKIVADCGEPAVHNIAIHILDDVASALATANYDGSLKDEAQNIVGTLVGVETSRAVEQAYEAIKCAVAEVQSNTSDHLGYGHLGDGVETQQKATLAHAADWLARH